MFVHEGKKRQSHCLGHRCELVCVRVCVCCVYHLYRCSSSVPQYVLMRRINNGGIKLQSTKILSFPASCSGSRSVSLSCKHTHTQVHTHPLQSALRQAGYITAEGVRVMGKEGVWMGLKRTGYNDKGRGLQFASNV